jgi:hypothetical protein
VPAEVLPEVDPNGCVLPEVDPNGCDHAPAAVYIFDEDDEEEEVLLIRKNSRHYRGSEGGVIFLLQLLSAFRDCQYRILIRPLRRSSLRICYQSQLLMTWWLFV